MLVSAVNEMPLGSSRVQPKPHMTWKPVLEPGSSARSYVANVSSHWPLPSAMGRTTENDGVLMETGTGHATCAAGRLFRPPLLVQLSC